MKREHLIEDMTAEIDRLEMERQRVQSMVDGWPEGNSSLSSGRIYVGMALTSVLQAQHSIRHAIEIAKLNDSKNEQ